MIVAAVALVIYRAAVFVLWEQSHFDADQAIVGLMAKHLNEGRAFPLFFYGQQYLLGVEAWIVAPFFAVFGMSVLTLKLPLLLMNLAAGVYLILALERYGRVRPAIGAIASAFFLIPPPGTASRLVQANGCNIEPFLYVLALWSFRGRPIAFGVTAGIGFLHREFTAYGIAAILLLEAWQGTMFTQKRLAALAVSALVALGVWEVVQVLVPFASASGPGSSYASLAVPSHTDVVVDRFCWNPGEIDDRLHLLATTWLPEMFGGRRQSINSVGVMSTGSQGLNGAWLTLSVAMLFAAVRGATARDTTRSKVRAGASLRDLESNQSPTMFCAYLVLTGLQSAIMYAVMCGQRSHLTMRYMLLALLVPIGVTAWYLAREHRPSFRFAYAGVMLAWACVSVVDHAILLHEYRVSPPANDYRTLTTYLERAGLEQGSAGFWDAYAVTFLSGERVRLASFDLVRIEEYQAALDAPVASAPRISTSPCDGERVARWWVCR